MAERNIQAGGSVAGSIIEFSNWIALSGGSVAILALLRESKKLLETALSARSRRQITIKADGVIVELKSSNDVGDALRIFEQVATKREGSRRAPVNKQAKVGLLKGKEQLEVALSDKDAPPHLFITADGEGTKTARAGTQIIVSDGLSIEFRTLSNELSLLREAMRRSAQFPEHDLALAKVAEAEAAVKKSDIVAALRSLRAAGRWALEMATGIGAKVAAETIRRAIFRG